MIIPAKAKAGQTAGFQAVDKVSTEYINRERE